MKSDSWLPVEVAAQLKLEALLPLLQYLLLHPQDIPRVVLVDPHALKLFLLSGLSNNRATSISLNPLLDLGEPLVLLGDI